LLSVANIALLKFIMNYYCIFFAAIHILTTFVF